MNRTRYQAPAPAPSSRDYQQYPEYVPESKGYDEHNLYEPMRLRCVESDCQKKFEWTVGEQEFMHQLLEEGKIPDLIPPRRCAPCRERRRIRFNQKTHE